MLVKRISQVFLALLALAFCKTGLEALLDPQAVLAQVGIGLDSAAALSSMRAVYGGMHLVFGLFCLYGVFGNQTQALTLIVLYTTGFVLGRLISWNIDGTPNAFVITWLGTETFSLIVSAGLLTWFKKREPVSKAMAL